MTAAFRLSVGDLGPVQQSGVTCGSACLTVARMLVDSVFATWIKTGRPQLPGAPIGASEAERFAAYERIVHSRTNGAWYRSGTLNVPWPRALGTPPWGAKHELEYGAARRGTQYAVEVLRTDSEDSLRDGYARLVDVVAEGEPGLLYIGDARLPRHVVLVLPGNGDRVIDVYDPATGRVQVMRRDAFAARQVGLSGWQVPWLTIQPTGLRTARLPAFSGDADPAPA